MSSPSALLEKRAMHGTHDADGVDSSFSSYDSLSSLVQAPLPVRELSGGAPTSTALPFRSNPNPTTRQWSDDLPTAVRRRAFVRRALELPTAPILARGFRSSGSRSKKREAKDDDGGIDDDDDDVLELPPTRQKVLETKLQYLEGGLLSTLEELRSMRRIIETET
ncbi:MAG: hypothetical protein M1815_001521 [Lichina confinis]|nr:MAG: hypothetical protein M1815_001521 [Lichina confinis]